jgi:hypothetical protein
MCAALEVELTGEQLHALCVGVTWLVEADNPPPELAEVRPALESVEELLVFAWADAQLAGWEGTGWESGVT